MTFAQLRRLGVVWVVALISACTNDEPRTIRIDFRQSPQNWTAGVELKANAVLDHWRVTPGFSELHMLEVPLEQTRIALIQTNAADIVEASLKNVKALVVQTFADALLPKYHHKS